MTDYLDGFQYVNHALNFFPHAEGFVDVKGTNAEGYKYFYVYNYTDHLGNIRVSYGFDPDTKTVKTLEENHYYPFGLKHTNYNTYKRKFIKDDNPPINPTPGVLGLVGFSTRQIVSGDLITYKYKYNGKEFQDELGLNVYDYLFRQYTPDIVRFTTIDPMADFVNYQSPYVFSDNNPVMNIDDDGLGILNVVGNLFKRLVGAIRSIGNDCSCNKYVQESIARAWDRPDFPKVNNFIYNLFDGSNSNNSTPTPSSIGREGRPQVVGIDTINPSGIAINNNIDIQAAEINIPTPRSSTPSPRPTPIPIIGNRDRIRFNRNVEFGNSSTKLNTPHTEKTLRDLIKTLVDYPQLIVFISANVSINTDQLLTHNRDTGVRIDGENGTLGGLQLARAKAIQRFLIKRGVSPKQIIIKEGKIKTDGSNPDATFNLINPKK
jgi:RHS repeat-associated protein